MQYIAIQYNAIQYNAIQYVVCEWFGMLLQWLGLIPVLLEPPVNLANRRKINYLTAMNINCGITKNITCSPERWLESVFVRVIDARVGMLWCECLMYIGITLMLLWCRAGRDIVDAWIGPV